MFSVINYFYIFPRMPVYMYRYMYMKKNKELIYDR